MGFKKGQTGNPSGRPKKSNEEKALTIACKEKTLDAFNILVSLLDSKNESLRFRAAATILERGFGKPRTINGKNMIDYLKIINSLQEKIKEKDSQIKNILTSTYRELKALESLDTDELLQAYDGIQKKILSFETKFPVLIDGDEYEDIDSIVEDYKTFIARYHVIENCGQEELNKFKKESEYFDNSVRIVFDDNKPMFCALDIFTICNTNSYSIGLPKSAVKLKYSYKDKPPKELYFINKVDTLNLIKTLGAAPTPFMMELSNETVFPVAFLRPSLIVKQ